MKRGRTLEALQKHLVITKPMMIEISLSQLNLDPLHYECCFLAEALKIYDIALPVIVLIFMPSNL